MKEGTRENTRNSYWNIFANRSRRRFGEQKFVDKIELVRDKGMPFLGRPIQWTAAVVSSQTQSD